MRSVQANPVEGNHVLFSFLTTKANAEVVHEKGNAGMMMQL